MLRDEKVFNAVTQLARGLDDCVYYPPSCESAEPDDPMTNLFDLNGRTAVVTGSAQGMGRAMALAFAEAGADLVLLDRNAAGIEATAHTISQLGCRALPIEGDVTDTDHMDHVFATVDRECGRVDILGNVAGEAKAGAAEDMALADIRAACG
jgi:NAD(P)-dependent dehydrogenase (short-subunit alcohol dehydrogenase family)